TARVVNNPSTRRLDLGPPQRQASAPVFDWTKSSKAPLTSARNAAAPAAVVQESNEGDIAPARVAPPVRVVGPQPWLKRLTTPVPFQLTTQFRAETRLPRHSETHGGVKIPATSRLAGLAPLGLSKTTQPSKTHFVPTVPISPKLGRQEGIRRFRPPVPFLAKKSTKELTAPQAFHFHSDERAKLRELFDQSEREQRRQTHEQLERTYKARPIKHYQPIVIHKSERPLTKPISPMIGEKRKRYKMEKKYREQEKERERWEAQLKDQQQLEAEMSAKQRQERARKSVNGGSGGSSHIGHTGHGELGAIRDGHDLYPSFEQAKILQEQQETLKNQLIQHELKQLDLANSTHASIHQPPIRLSFPLDPEIKAHQADPFPSPSASHGGHGHGDGNESRNRDGQH
ncbi:hypothetical protein BGZ94_004256, partial [Podila epigama]